MLELSALEFCEPAAAGHPFRRAGTLTRCNMPRHHSKFAIYAVSGAAHVVVISTLLVASRHVAVLREIIPITFRDETPPPTRRNSEKPEPAPEPSRPNHNRVNRSASASKDRSESAAGPFTELGLVLDSTASGGIAFNADTPAEVPAPNTAQRSRARVRRDSSSGGCTEDPSKPKVAALAHAHYTVDARRANVAGVVRLELLVDEQGQVSSVRVLRGVGYGLDEEAIRAARRFRFVPAERCGVPVAARFVLGVRFQSGR